MFSYETPHHKGAKVVNYEETIYYFAIFDGNSCCTNDSSRC